MIHTLIRFMGVIGLGFLSAGCDSQEKPHPRVTGAALPTVFILDKNFDAISNSKPIPYKDWTSKLAAEDFDLFKKGEERKSLVRFGIDGDLDAARVYQLFSGLASDASISDWVLFLKDRPECEASFTVTNAPVYRTLDALPEADYERLMKSEENISIIHQKENMEFRSFHVRRNDPIGVSTPGKPSSPGTTVITLAFFDKTVKSTVLLAVCQRIQNETHNPPLLVIADRE